MPELVHLGLIVIVTGTNDLGGKWHDANKGKSIPRTSIANISASVGARKNLKGYLESSESQLSNGL